jgi:hypothetical protein
MRNRWGLILSLAAIGGLAAACSSASTPTPNPVVSTAPSASESPSLSPAGSVGGASALPSASASAMPSESAGASSSTAANASPMTSSDLQSKLPTHVGTMTLAVKSATAADLPMFAGDAGKAALAALFATLKTTPDQAAAAIASSSDKSVTIAALSVGGVDASAVQNGIYGILAATSKGVTSSIVTVSGKSVTQLQNLDTPTVTIYIYTKDSAVYVIWVNDPKLGEDALSKLP